MATVFNPLTGKVTTTPDTVKTSPSLGQFNNAATPLSDLQQSAADARAAANATKTAVVDPGRAAQQAAADALNAAKAFPPKGTVIGYLESAPGTRIPKIADGKGGYTTRLPEKDPDYDPTKGTGKKPVVSDRPPMPMDGKTYTWDDNKKAWVESNVNTSSNTAKGVDSIAAISALLSSYGIGDLSAAVTAAVTKGYSSDTIQLIMQDPNSNDPLAVAFQTRFPANKARLAAGKSVLSASEYLQAERTYTQVLQSYGVGNMAKRDTLNSFISNDISASEVSDRVSLAVNRVQNADPFTKAALAEYYPTLNQSDIVGALLNPAEGLPSLQRKIQIGEIGGAAAMQGLNTGLATQNNMLTNYSNVTSGALGAEALASLGITQAQARQGYQQVAELTPRGEFLSSISSGADYTRLQAEQEAFLGLASAKQARLDLTEQEKNRFAGSAGTSKATPSSNYLTKQSNAGQF